jgi:hypothetical protein
MEKDSLIDALIETKLFTSYFNETFGSKDEPVSKSSNLPANLKSMLEK